MANENLGANFSIDITQLKAGLAQANRLIRESESEFRAAAAGMDDWSNSQKGLEKRIDSFNDQIDIQRKKIDALIDVKEATIKKMEEEGATTLEIEQAVDKFNKQITRESQQLDKLKSSLNKSEKALQELKDASDDAGKEIDELGDEAKDAEDGFTVMKGAAADLISSGIQALGGAIKDLITNFASLAEETREYREDMGKLQTAFETAGKSTEVAKDTYKEFYAVLGEEDRSVEAVNHLAKLVDTEEDMAKWTDICAGVWGTFGDSLPIEGLTEAA